MNVETIVNNIMEKKLDDMRQNINAVLSEKTAEKLEELKLGLASNYFKSNE